MAILKSAKKALRQSLVRKARNLVRQNEYKNLFKISLAEDSRSVGHWHTEKGGSYIAVGVGGALTGKGADLLIIDDPIKGHIAALTEDLRRAPRRPRCACRGVCRGNAAGSRGAADPAPARCAAARPAVAITRCE